MDQQRPKWIRAPKRGVEFWSGLCRSKLYQLDTEGAIRSISLRSAGQQKGTRLFDLDSIFDFYERVAAAEKATPPDS